MLDLEHLARSFGSSLAILEPQGGTTYAELVEGVGAALSRLGSMGVAAGDRVALVCEQDRATVVRALALLERGCAVLPLGPELGEQERLRSCSAFGALWLWRGEAWPQPLATPAPGAALQEAPLRERPVQGLLSSGSTGTPKIALRSAVQLRACVSIHARRLGLGPGDRVVAVVPLAFAYGFNNVMLATLSSGACIVFPSSRHPRRLLDEIGSQGVTVLGSTPVFFDLMLRFGAGSCGPIGGVRVALAVGDALSRRVQSAFAEAFGVLLWHGYGSSETGPALIHASDAADGDAVALGGPYPGVEVTLRDEADRPVGEGELGEIVVRSAGVALGYAGGQQGARPFDGDRFFTGDLGVLRDGQLYFAGRRKLLLNTAGRKVDPVEVERVLLLHPGVADAAVVGLRDAGREWIRAVVVATGSLSSVELMEFCSRSLAAYKVPRVFEFRSSLPRSPSGKLLRGRL